MVGETKVCPVCDSTIESEARQCPECNTDLSLFDVDADGELDLDKSPTPGGKSIDDILQSIVGGKRASSDFFEDMKSVAKDSVPEDDDILADTEVEPGVEFACPNCGTNVAATAKVCPGCGVEFAEESVEQFECPLCNAVVDMDATACPNCGVKFADEEEEPARTTAPAPPPPKTSVRASPTPAIATTVEIPRAAAPGATRVGLVSPMERLWSLAESRREPSDEPFLDRSTLYKELPRLVNDVKPLLLAAKRVGVEIGNEKDLISDAIAKGKKRDIEQAVRLIRQARFQLESSFTSQIAKRIESVLVEAERSRATGADVGAIVTLCNAAIDALSSRDYVTSAEKVKSAREEFEARSGGYAKARQELQAVQSLVGDAKKLGVTVREVDSFLSRGEAAMTAKNWDQAAGYAVQARQALMKVLPEALSREMKRARNALLEMKVKGGDLTKPVGILKQASIHIKREEFADAVKFVRMFQDEVGPF